MAYIHSPQRYTGLPRGKGTWHSLEELQIPAREGVALGGEEEGITNSTSRYPVIGTKGVIICTAVIVYDRLHKKALVAHHATWNRKIMEDALAHFPPGTVLEAHIAGGYGPYAKPAVRAILEGLRHCDKKITVKTFAIYPKPRPMDMAIDTRTGKLIACSPFFDKNATPLQMIDESAESFPMRGWVNGSELMKPGGRLAFDGRLPVHQLRRRGAGSRTPAHR